MRLNTSGSSTTVLHLTNTDTVTGVFFILGEVMQPDKASMDYYKRYHDRRHKPRPRMEGSGYPETGGMGPVFFFIAVLYFILCVSGN